MAAIELWRINNHQGMQNSVLRETNLGRKKQTSKKENIRMKRSVLIALSVGLAYAFPAHAQKQVAKTFTMPVQVHAAVGFSDCSNSPGPQITLDGSITLGGLNVELIFRNNVKGTHTYVAEQTAEVVAVPVGGALVIPKQPPLGGVGGNPSTWLQF